MKVLTPVMGVSERLSAHERIEGRSCVLDLDAYDRVGEIRLSRAGSGLGVTEDSASGSLRTRVKVLSGLVMMMVRRLEGALDEDLDLVVVWEDPAGDGDSLMREDRVDVGYVVMLGESSDAWPTPEGLTKGFMPETLSLLPRSNGAPAFVTSASPLLLLLECPTSRMV